MNITKHILIASIASIAFILIIAICSAVYFSIFSIIKSSSSIEGFANKYFDKKKEFFGCCISLLDYSNDMKFYSCLNDDSVKIVREFYEDFVKELKNRYNVENLNIREKHIYYTILFDATMQLEFFEQELPRYMPSVIAYDDCLFGTIINQGSGDGTHVFKTIIF